MAMALQNLISYHLLWCAWKKKFDIEWTVRSVATMLHVQGPEYGIWCGASASLTNLMQLNSVLFVFLLLLLLPLFLLFFFGHFDRIVAVLYTLYGKWDFCFRKQSFKLMFNSGSFIQIFHLYATHTQFYMGVLNHIFPTVIVNFVKQNGDENVRKC